MRWLLFLLIAVQLAGCSLVNRWLPFLPSVRDISLNPVQAVTKEELPDASGVWNLRLLGTRRAPDGRVAAVYILEEKVSGNRPGGYTMGYDVVERAGFLTWQVVVRAHAIHDLPPKEDLPIDYEVYQDTYTAVFGPVFLKQVRVVEVLFADGETIRERASGSYYLIFSPRPVSPCRIQALDRDGQVLYESYFSRLYSECDGLLPA